MKVLAGVIVLLLLILFNPGIEQHRNAVEEVMDKGWNEYVRQDDHGLLESVFLFFAGDSVKSVTKAVVLDALYRKNFVLFSVGCIDGKLVSFGTLGFVYVWE